MSARASIVSAALWVTLPKCPLCLAAYSSILSAADLARVEPIYDELQLALISVVVIFSGWGLYQRRRSPRAWLTVPGVLLLIAGRAWFDSDVAAWVGVVFLIAAARHGWLTRRLWPATP